MIYDRLITRQTFHHLRRCTFETNERTNGFFLINFAILSHLNIRTAELSSNCCCCCIHNFHCNFSQWSDERERNMHENFESKSKLCNTQILYVYGYIFRYVDFLLLLLFVYLCNECGAAAQQCASQSIYSSIYEHCEVNNLFRPSTTYNFNHIWK